MGWGLLGGRKSRVWLPSRQLVESWMGGGIEDFSLCACAERTVGYRAGRAHPRRLFGRRGEERGETLDSDWLKSSENRVRL